MNYKKRTKILALILGLATTLTTPLLATPVELGSNSDIIERLKSNEDVVKPNIDKFQNKRNVSVIVDGVNKTSQIPADQKPILTDKGVTYVSVKMFETIIPNVYLDYTAKDSLVRVNYKEKWIYVMLGKPIAFKAHPNGFKSEIFTADNTPTTVNGRTYLPLRFAVESLGCLVAWDGKTNTIGISTTGEAPIMPKEEEQQVTSKHYWGGKPFIPGAKDKIIDNANKTSEYSGFRINGELITIGCIDTPTKESDSGQGLYAGQISAYRSEDKSQTFEKQTKEIERMLATLISTKDAKHIADRALKSLKASYESEPEYFEYGNYKFEMWSSRHMNVKIGIMIYLKNK